MCMNKMPGVLFKAQPSMSAYLRSTHTHTHTHSLTHTHTHSLSLSLLVVICGIHTRRHTNGKLLARNITRPGVPTQFAIAPFGNLLQLRRDFVIQKRDD